MSAKCPISVLIPTRNEEANLAACLQSCAFADEVVVVDSSSTDRTPAIAREHGATVVNFLWDGEYPKKKNWALAHFAWRHEWVFILDADERITAELAQELEATLAAPGHDGYYINRKFWFLDGWLNHCGYYPSWNLRFFRHRLGRYEQLPGLAQTASGDNEVHEHVVLRGTSGRLRGEMEHYAFPTIEVWVEKHNRYSNWEALFSVHSAAQGASAAQLDRSLTLKRQLKAAFLRAPFRPALRFGYHYLCRAGFLDGYRGYVFCRLMAFYEFLSVAKRSEMQRRSAERKSDDRRRCA